MSLMQYILDALFGPLDVEHEPYDPKDEAPAGGETDCPGAGEFHGAL